MRPNASDGRYEKWVAACLLIVDFFHFCGESSMMTASYLYNRIPRSSLNMETPHKMLYGHTRRRKERCAALFRARATHFASRTPRSVESSKAGASSSSEHRTCLPLPGGFRRYRDWKVDCLISATTVSSTTTLRVKT